MIRFLTAGAAVGVLISGCAALDDLGPRDYPLEQLVAIDVGAETEAEAQQAFESKPEQGAAEGESSVAEADRPNGPGATPILDGDRTASKPEPDLAKPDLAKPETAKARNSKARNHRPKARAAEARPRPRRRSRLRRLRDPRRRNRSRKRPPPPRRLRKRPSRPPPPPPSAAKWATR